MKFSTKIATGIIQSALEHPQITTMVLSPVAGAGIGALYGGLSEDRNALEDAGRGALLGAGAGLGSVAGANVAAPMTMLGAPGSAIPALGALGAGLGGLAGDKINDVLKEKLSSSKEASMPISTSELLQLVKEARLGAAKKIRMAGQRVLVGGEKAVQEAAPAVEKVAPKAKTPKKAPKEKAPKTKAAPEVQAAAPAPAAPAAPVQTPAATEGSVAPAAPKPRAKKTQKTPPFSLNNFYDANSHIINPALGGAAVGGVTGALLGGEDNRFAGGLGGALGGAALGAGGAHLWNRMPKLSHVVNKTALDQAYEAGLKLACVNNGLPEHFFFEKVAGRPSAKQVAAVTRKASKASKPAQNAAARAAAKQTQESAADVERALLSKDMTTSWWPYALTGAGLGAGAGYYGSDEGNKGRGALIGGLAGLGAGLGLRAGAGKGLTDRAALQAKIDAAALGKGGAVGKKGKAIAEAEALKGNGPLATAQDKLKQWDKERGWKEGLKGLGAGTALGIGGGALGSYLMPNQNDNPYAAALAQAQQMGQYPQGY